MGYDLLNRPPNLDRVVNLRLRMNIRDLYRSSELRLRQGRQNGGDYLFASYNQGFKLNDRLSLSLSAERLSLAYHRKDKPDRRITQAVLSGVYDLTSERGFVFRFVGSEKGTNGYAAYRQEMRHGSDLFLVLGDPNTNTFTGRIGLKIVNTY